MSQRRRRALRAQPAPLTPEQLEKLHRFRDDLQRRRDEELQWRAVWADDQERGQ